jgi:protease-4
MPATPRPAASLLRALPGRRPPLLLEVDLSDELVEERPEDLLGRLRTRTKTPIRELVEALSAAADDPGVGGLVGRVSASRLSPARAEDLREAAARFAASGKPAICYAETFGPASGGTAAYLLATGFPEVWLQPTGDLDFTGVSAQVPFLRRLLDRLGVQAQLAQRYEYKGAADTLLREAFTPAGREASQRIVDSLAETLVATVAAARRLDPQRVREVMDEAPLSAREALAAGLVDRLGYRDEVYAEARRRMGGAARLLFAHHYRRHRPAADVARSIVTRRRTGEVAVVPVTGAIRQGRSRRGATGAQAAGSDTVAAALRAAGADRRVGAVVLRVNSPGGSAVASDTIWREVVRVQEQGTPVVVSMAEVAASGGYYVSCPARAIVAQPGTLTGSIGVFGGKVVLAGLLDRLGVAVEAASAGRRARMFSVHQPFSSEEWERVEAMLDRIYDDFVRRVAEGRRLDRDLVEQVARGRVWTGVDARRHGLVDGLGGLPEALDRARRLAGLPASTPARRYPHPTPPVARLRPARSSEDQRAAAAAAAASGRSSPVPAGPLQALVAAVAEAVTDELAGSPATLTGWVSELALLAPPVALG